MARSTRSTRLPISASPEMDKEALQNSTNARPKRRGRPPKGALAAKLKAKAKAASPLPPSSLTHSPSPSSEWAEPNSIPIATSDDPPLPTYVDEQKMLRQDFESYLGSDDAGPDADISTASDPFGFFRVERTLKRDRGTSDVPAYPTPEANGGSPSTPSTPRRRRSSSRPGATSRQQFSMPSSPSPIKPSHRRKPTDPESESSDRSPERQTSPDGLVESDAEPDSPPPKAKTKGKQKAAKRSLNPEQIQKEWEAVLPKRTRRTRKEKEKATVESESEDEQEAPTRKKARRKANAKTPRAQKREKDDVDTEVDEVR